MKRSLLTLALFMVSITASLAETLTGSYGENVTYTLDTETGVLKIEGTGEMKNSLSAPWYSKRSYVKEVQIAQGVTHIGSYAFMNCSSLNSATIPESVTNIKSYAFNGCTSLTSIIIPNNVTSIGYMAFSGCTSLTDVTCLAATTPTCDRDPFSTYGTLHVLPSYGDAYRTADVWKDFTIVEDAAENTDKNIATQDDAVYANNSESQAGKQFILPIQMKSTIEATGFQADLVLPEGITVAEDGDGFPMVELSTQRTTATKTNMFDYCYQADGSLRIVCNSTKGIAFTGNDGEVALVTLNISEEIEEGDYPIIIKNIVITDAQGTNKKKVKMTESVLKIVSSTEEGGNSEPDSWECTHIRGDVNGDGEVTIEDVNEVIDILLKKKSAESAEPTTPTTPTEPVDPYNGHEYVDLGLPSGLKWATCNVGAEKPEDYGDYYAWGETETKSTYTWDTYFDSDFAKYSTSKKTTLDPEDDVAHVKWGGDWRMPTKAEQDELRDTNNCTWTWTTQGGKNGYKVTSKKNGNSIFLPAAGYRLDSDLDDAGSWGNYWSSSLSSYDAYGLYFNSGDVGWHHYNRVYGFAVRPVCP